MFRSGTLPITPSSAAILIIISCVSAVLVSSSAVVELSLANATISGSLWVTDTQTEVPPNSELVVRITDISTTSAFTTIHVHSYPTTSYVEVKPPNNGTIINGSDVGFVHPTAHGPPVFTISNPLKWPVQLMIVARAYDVFYSVPGGCALEFPTKVAPYVIVEIGDDTISVKGQKGARTISDHLCLDNDLEYEFYYTYTSEKIEQASDHFARLRAMLNYSEIVDKAYRAYWMDGPPTQRVFAKYPGVCTYYAMAVKGPLNRVALYSPSSSTLCSADVWSSLPLSTKALLGLLLPIGMVLCFAGHSMLNTSIFFTTFFAGHSVSYVGLSVSGVTPEDAETYAIYAAVAIAGCVVLVLLVINSPIIFVAITIGCACYLFFAAIFYIFAGNLQQFASGPSYWISLVVLVVGVTALLIAVPQITFLAALSTIGGYIITYVVDHYFVTHVKYVTINPIRRLTVQGFASAITSPPLETADILIFALWVTLAIFGFEKQRRRARGKAPFPPPPRFQIFTSEERRPLLPDALEHQGI